MKLHKMQRREQNISEHYNTLETLKDDREFAFGEIWKLRDDLIPARIFYN
jgi:cell division protein FtsB